MRYRIKIITYASGRITYIAQKKALIGWIGIGFNGDTSYHYTSELDDKDSALKRIHKHQEGNHKRHTITFEEISYHTSNID